ncbi:MAG: DsrE family protein [Sphingobium sp.]|nr:DsrE family protein [Sphingobium sp.]MCP5398429.1 DsrE family protein [Sphingomonas sp.]
MPSLNVIILTEDAERFRGILTLATSYLALGHPARLFLQLDAVRLLAPPIAAPRDAEHVAQGLPSLSSLLEEALDSGMEIVACQSGLALTGMEADSLDPRIQVGGPVSFLQSTSTGERLLAV